MADVRNQIDTLLADNTSGAISAEDMRTVLHNMLAATQPRRPTLKKVGVATNAGSRGPLIPYNVDNVFRASDFTLCYMQCSIAWESTSKQYIAGRQAISGVNGCNVVFSNKYLRIEARDTGTGANTVIGASTTQVDQKSWHPLDIVLSVSLNTDGSAVFTWYVDGLQLGNTVNVSATHMGFMWAGNSDWTLFSFGNTLRNQALIQEVIYYNRALSVDDIESLRLSGPSAIDIGKIGGRATNDSLIQNGGFDDGTTSWGLQGTAASYTVTSGELIVTRGSDTTATYQAFPTVIGNRYIITGERVATTAGSPPGITVSNTALGTALNSINPAAGETWELDFIATADTTFLNLYAGQSEGDTTTYDNIASRTIGATGWWSAERAQGDTAQILNHINTNHALMPATGATILPPVTGGCVQTSLEWDGTSTAKYLCANQDLFPVNAYITRVIVRFDGTPVDGTLGTAADADRYCTLADNTGLQQSNTLAIAEPIADNDNLELLWTPAGTLTSTVYFHIEYEVLEAI